MSQIYAEKVTTPEGQDQRFKFYALKDETGADGSTVSVRAYQPQIATVAQLNAVPAQVDAQATRVKADAAAKLAAIAALPA